ncbi:sulfur carrier protein ThiS [Cellulomonas dongxiuzhuiae]|uniref:Sulfur carrier protein ThiS n=1 Tax=Cellulomonas dongxiuzhuiae TaxID=2819979 RepID=A0ABX8GKR9_9CELL|nr:sulfur carrier protein ThiS [Cellulomonas dongxiuzhuiae]MBO3095570.1 sulfur carrier protein ThiS [Cellulomonas dongxiuzhuiae]QWC16540.1 sulfur carrier protein ThiS [Cellulomonas dongxiuzhuiae]
MTQTRTTDPRTADTEELPVVAAAPAQVVTVNGLPQPWDPGLTVATVVQGLLSDATTAPAGCATGTTPTGVAAALDDAIVPRGLWTHTPVPAGARLEIVTAVQGG